MNNQVHSSVGGSLEEFLDDLGIREEVYEEAIKSVIVWQIEEARRNRSMSKSAMATKNGYEPNPS